MKMLTLIGITITLAISAIAQAEEIPATEIRKACQASVALGPGKISTDTAICRLIIQGFMDGYRMGAFHGMSTVYIHDEKAGYTVQGFENLQFRLTVNAPRAECLPKEATVSQVADVFIQHMKKHPEQENTGFGEPLRDAIENYYCSN